MKYNWASTRSYLTITRPKDPNPPLSVVHWMGTRNAGTGGCDAAFSEVSTPLSGANVILKSFSQSIHSTLEFDDPTTKVEFKYLEGGSKVLVDAMLNQVETKPSYGHFRRTGSPDTRPILSACMDQSAPFPLRVSGKEDEYFGQVVSTTTLVDGEKSV